MVVRRTQERKEEKEKVRRALMRATLRLASSYGFPSLSLREASREAGIAPTSFYRHFEDMEQLGVAIVDELVGPTLLDLVQPCRANAKEPWDVPALALQGLLAWTATDPDAVRFLIAERVGCLNALRSCTGARIDAFADELRDAMNQRVREKIAPWEVRAVVLVLLEAAHAALEASAEQVQAARDEAMAQLALLRAGTDATRNA